MLDSPAPALDEATAILRRTFGHAAFRGLQAEVIAEALAGRHALAVLPTGGGKSLCYQIPAMMRHHDSGGLCFVRYLAYQQASRAISNRGGASRARGGE